MGREASLGGAGAMVSCRAFILSAQGGVGREGKEAGGWTWLRLGARSGGRG